VAFGCNVLSNFGVEVDRGAYFLKNIRKFRADYGATSLKTVFLDPFAKLRKATFSFVVSVCPSVLTENLACQRLDLHEIWYLIILRKSFE
jgi:hypothetical protein